MSKPSTWLFYRKDIFEGTATTAESGYVTRKKYKGDVVVLRDERGNTITYFPDGSIHRERPTNSKPRYESAEQTVGAMAMVEFGFLGEPGTMFVVDGLPRFWCDKVGSQQAYDYLAERMLTADETSYRLEDLANHHVCEPEEPGT